MIHWCIRCGNACDCMAFDNSHGDLCDGCSDCGDFAEEPAEDARETGRSPLQADNSERAAETRRWGGRE